MKNNRDSRLEIRLPENIKIEFQDYAKKYKTTMSSILLAYILYLIQEEEKQNGIQS